MKTIINLFSMLIAFFSLLFKNIEGAASSSPEMPVLAGLDAIIKMDGNTIGWATNCSFDEDFELQAIRTLGFHGDRGFKSQGYTCSITVGTFTLQANVPDALPVPTRQTILTSGMVDFELIDLVSGKTLWILHQCKCATAGTTFDSGSLSTKNTTWKCREAIPMNVSGVQS